MKNLLGRMAVIGSTYVATALGGDLTNQPSTNTNVPSYNAKSSLESLREADRIKQQQLGHSTNVFVYNSKTGKIEKKQIWTRPDDDLMHRTSLGGMVLGPNTGKYDSLFVGPVQVNLPRKSSAETNVPVIYVGPVPIAVPANSPAYFVQPNK